MNRLRVSRYALCFCVAAIVLVGCGGSQSQLRTVPPQGASTRYSVEALTTPLGGGVAEGISNRDWIVGSTNGQRGCCISRAALWRNESFTDLGTLGGPNSFRAVAGQR